MEIMQFLELHARKTEFMKVLLFHVRITHNHANPIIPHEKHENYKNPRIPQENQNKS